jgi:hypothetical protein
VVLSTASDLSPPSSGHGKRQIYRHDRVSNTTIVVSRKTGATGLLANQHCDSPSISDDGDVIVFQTTASLVTLDNNGLMDIYLRVVSTNTTFLLSRGRHPMTGNAVAANGASFDAAVSGDGMTAAFTSAATNLLFPNNIDSNSRQDVFVALTNPPDFAERVSIDDNNQQSTTTHFTTAGATGLGVGRVISSDGLLVLFHGTPCDWSSAAGVCSTIDPVHLGNCLCPDTDNDCTGSVCGTAVQQVYLRDRNTAGPARTFRVSRVSSGTAFVPGNGASRRAGFNDTASIEGFSVTWSSTATNFSGDTDATEDVFVFAADTPTDLDIAGGAAPLNPIAAKLIPRRHRPS